jgi:hypothetical protein
MRRRRWDLARHIETGMIYVRGLEWFEEPYETGSEEDDGLTEAQCDLRARQQVLADARRGDPLSIKALLFLHGIAADMAAPVSAPGVEPPIYGVRASTELNPEFPLVLLGSDDAARPGALSEPLAGWLGEMSLADYYGDGSDESGPVEQIWFWRLARPLLKKLANDVLLEVLDEALGLPVVSRSDDWAQAVVRLRRWREVPRSAWFELVPEKLRDAVGVGPQQVDPLTAPPERLVLTSYAWPGGYEILYLVDRDREEVVTCHRCANASAEPWTIKHWGSVEYETPGEIATRCGACERVIVPSEAANEITIPDKEIVRETATPENPIRCDECREVHHGGQVVRIETKKAWPVKGLHFCDEACAKEFIASAQADEEDDEDTPSGPDEEDLVTEDHRRFYSHGVAGRVRVTVPEGEDWRPHVRAWMQRSGFFPNVWFLSDHGNYHLMSMSDEQP